MQMLDVLIIAHYNRNNSISDYGRFIYLAKNAPAEWDIEIVTSDFDHIKKERKKDYDSWNFRITYLHEPGYKKNITPARFFSDFVWGENVKRFLKTRKKPDVVYCAVPSLVGPYNVAKYCEKNGIRFVIDIQDLWPEAFRMVFRIPLLSFVFFCPIKALADGIYRRADVICAVSDTYCERARSVNSKVVETTTVFLGTDLSAFDKYAAGNPILEKRDGEIWLAYCGTLGSSYDLTCVIDALAIINNSHLCFIVMGDGPRKDEFENYAKGKKVNAVFVGRLQYNLMCSLLCICDITLNPISHMAAQSIINKHADYAASGLPVISTQESSEYRKLIDDYHMGFNCKNNDSFDLAEKIRILVDNGELRKSMGANARRCAEERFDRRKSYQKLMIEIEGEKNENWNN